MINTLTTALSGILSAGQKVSQSAENIASIGVDSNDGANLPRDIIDIKLAETEFKANLKVVETVSDLTEELLKTFDEEV